MHTADEGPNTAFNTACMTQTLDQADPGQYYVTNTVTSTGERPCSKGDLTGIDSYFTWGKGNTHMYTRVQWNPISSSNVGNPQTFSFGIAYSGVSAGVSQTVYPSRLDPEFPYGPQDSQFGSHWSGDNCDTYNGSPSDALIHLGPGAPGNAGITATVYWAN